MGLVVVLVVIAVVVLVVRSMHQRDELAVLRQRIERLEQQAAAPPITPAPVAVPAPSVPTVPPATAPPSFSATSPSPQPSRAKTQLEALIGEHALALVGGLFVLVAAVFFVTYAIDQGWIAPWMRIMLAAAFGAVLMGIGAWMGARLPIAQRQGRAIGSLHGVLAGVGSAVISLAIVAGVRMEGVLDAASAVAAQLVVGTVTVELARRWRSQDLAAFGIVVALAAPMLVGASADGVVVTLLFVAILASTVVAVTQRWARLLVVAGTVTAPQLLDYAGSDTSNLTAICMVLGAWWAILAAGALACALREQAPPRSTIAVVLAAPAVVVGGVGLVSASQPPNAILFAAFALVQLAVAVAAWLRWRDQVAPLSVALVGAASATLALAAGSVLDGSAAAWAWAAEAVALWTLWGRTRDWVTAVFTAGLTLIMLMQVLVVLFTARLLSEQLWAVAAVLVAALAARQLVRRCADRVLELVAGLAAWLFVALVLVWQLDASLASLALGAWAACGMLAAAAGASVLRRSELVVVMVLAFVIANTVMAAMHLSDGAPLLVTTTAALASLVAHRVLDRSGSRYDDPMLAAAALWACAGLAWLLFAVTPSNLRVFSSTLSVGMVLVLGIGALVPLIALNEALRALDEAPLAARRAAATVLAITGVYVVSIGVVGAFTPAGSAPHVESQPQVALTLSWVAIGVAALFAGTSHRLRAYRDLRVGAYALLGLAAAKLVLVDTADLEPPARIATFLVTGLGLLGSAALERRMRA